MSIFYKRLVSLIINIFISLMELYSVVIIIMENGFGVFKFYTDISNILALLSSACLVVYVIPRLKKPQISCPKIIKYLRLFSVSPMIITFLVVLIFLVPLSGGLATEFMLFFDTMLFHHFLCPIFIIVSFVFFEPDIMLTKKDSFLSVIPTIIYAGFILALNILHRIVGPYKFLLVFEQTIWVTIFWIIIIFSLAYFVGWTLYRLKRKKT